MHFRKANIGYCETHIPLSMYKLLAEDDLDDMTTKYMQFLVTC